MGHTGSVAGGGRVGKKKGSGEAGVRVGEGPKGGFSTGKWRKSAKGEGVRMVSVHFSNMKRKRKNIV